LEGFCHKTVFFPKTGGRGAHCYVVVTEWEEFKALTPDDFIKHMAEPIVVDVRHIFDPGEFRQRLRYKAVGLGDERRQGNNL
jgi:UDPglucose 6-dehydrogenase